MGLRAVFGIFLVVVTSAFGEAPPSPAILHLGEGDDWVSGFHPRRLTRTCHQRILLKPTRRADALGDPSRRLARRLFQEVALEHGSWHHLTRVGIDIAEIQCGEDVNKTIVLIKEKLGDQLDFIELDEEIYKPLQAPVDPLWTQQWGPQRVGFEGAWEQLEALDVQPTEVVVALIDTGFNFEHEDIQGRVWVNQGEIAGNGIDDDGNGFVDDVNGFNFVDNNGRPEDDGGHGTHNAGIIAAQVNDLGVAGAAGRNQMVKLMIVKALTATGGYASDAINAVNYAMAMGAHISSNSWGGHTESLALQQAIQVAMEAGHLFVSAAGNDNKNADANPYYPCVYPHVLCVAASNEEDEFTFFSNYGVESVELVAPGQNIMSTYLGNTEYASLIGTSFGTSMVAGAAALLLSWLRSATSTVKSVEDIRWLLLETAEKLSWTEGFVGSGMLDVDAAASKALSGVGYSWLVGPWSLCRRESCDETSAGIRLRNVSCVSNDGMEVDMAECSGEPECQDTIRGWRDSYDASCSIYESYNWCTSTGNYASGWLSTWGSFSDYANDGFDATQVCCACGSGVLEASNVPFDSQECPEPIGGPDANYDGVDDCYVAPDTTTATSVTTTTITATTVTVTTITVTTQTRSSTVSSTGTTSTGTSSTVTTQTMTSTTYSTTFTSTSSTDTTYSTITGTSTTTMTSTSTTASITSHTSSSTSSTTHTRTTSTSSSITVSSTSTTSSTVTSSSSSSSSSSTSTETATSSTTSSSTVTRTSSTTGTSSTTSTSTKSISSTSKTRTTSTSSSFTSTSSTSTSTTLTVRFAAPIKTTNYVQSTLLLVGSNQTPAGIDDALAAALAQSFEMQRSLVEVISVKAAVAAMFGPVGGRRLAGRKPSSAEGSPDSDPRRLQRSEASLEPALETEFQILLPQGSGVTVEEALDTIRSARSDPQPLRPLLGQVLETYGLVARENVTLRFTTPSAARVESVFVASVWGDCEGGAVCSNLQVPLRYRDVWCARLGDLATVEPDGLCSAGARPRTSEPCPDHVARPPACGWQISNWSSCVAVTEVCNGKGIQRREAVCLSVPPDDCGPAPATERDCQCISGAGATAAPVLSSEGAPLDGPSVWQLLPVVLGCVVGLGCCCSVALLCRRSRKVFATDARPESTEEVPDTPSRKAVSELLAECEQRQISTKGCLERSDLEDLLKERGDEDMMDLRKAASARASAPDRPGSPVSPSRVQHCAATEDSEEEGEEKDEISEAKPRPSPTASEVSTRQSGSPISSKSSTGLQGAPSSPAQPAVPLPDASAPSLAVNGEASNKARQAPPPIQVEGSEPQMEASPSSASRLRKTATWTSHGTSGTPSSGGRSPSRSRSTLSHLATTSRPATAASPATRRTLPRSTTSPVGRPGTSPTGRR